MTVKLYNTKELDASSSNPLITCRNKSSISLLSSSLTVSHFSCLRHERDVADEARTLYSFEQHLKDFISVARHYFQVFFFTRYSAILLACLSALFSFVCLCYF